MTEPAGTPRALDGRFRAPPITGPREPATQIRFIYITVDDSPSTIDTATIAADPREGDGAPNPRRATRQRSMWKRLARELRHFLQGT